MQHNITKHCADFLRFYFNDKYGVKLKSGHAHEIVAAFFGFKSRIAMLADKNDWDPTEFILSDPPVSLIDQRLQNLYDLSPDLPSSHMLAEVVYFVLVGLLCLQQNLKKFFKSGLPLIKWEMDLNIQHLDNEILSTVNVGYQTNTGETLRYSKYDIHLPRIAGSSGYGQPKVDKTFYSGGARKYSDEELLEKYPVPIINI